MAEDYVLVFARWINLSAAMVLFGSSLFPFYVGELRQLAFVPSRRFALSFACTALFGAALLMYRYAADIGAPDQISTTIWVILTETSFGVVWIVRIAASLLLVAVALIGSSPFRTGLTAGFAAALLITLGWDGHVVGNAPWGPLNQAVHLLMAGFWLGGLVPLAFTVRQGSSGTALQVGGAAQTLRRYSNLAIVAVTLVALTGPVAKYAPSGALGDDDVRRRPWASGLLARWVIGRGMAPPLFRTNVEQVLVPELQSDDIVFLDNLPPSAGGPTSTPCRMLSPAPPHKVAGVRSAI